MGIIAKLKDWASPWFGSASGSTASRRTKGKQVDGTSAPSSTDRVVTDDVALQLSTVWGCVKLLSETVGGMPVKFYRKNPDGTRTEEPDFHLTRLFNTMPNRWQTGIDYNTTLTISEAMRGNAYSLKQFGAKGRLIGLVPLMASQMCVMLLKDGSKSYLYTDGNTTTAHSESSIWHTMMMPSNAVIGLSAIEYGSRAIGIADSAENRVGNLARNGFKPAGVLMYDAILTEEQRTQIRKQFNDLVEGQGDPLRVLEAGMEYKQVSLSPKDVQLLESRQFSVEDLCRFFGVPSILVNDNQSTTWGTGISELLGAFYKLTVRPYLERREASIKKNLMTPDERLLYDVEYDFGALIRPDETTRIKNEGEAVRNGLRTINEARKNLDGALPVEGGDTVYLQRQMVPIEDIEDNENSQITTIR